MTTMNQFDIDRHDLGVQLVGADEFKHCLTTKLFLRCPFGSAKQLGQLEVLITITVNIEKRLEFKSKRYEQAVIAHA